MTLDTIRSAVRALFGGAPPFPLSKKVFIVTGGARGLGLEIARVLVTRGANVAICARTKLDVDAAVAELGMLESVEASHDGTADATSSPERKRANARTIGVVCDVTDAAAAQSFVAEVVRQFGRVDALVNNAGVMIAGPLSEMTRFDFEHAMETHFWGPLHMIHAVLPYMRADGGGRIANISSIGGKISVPHMLPYSASKFALTGLSTGLRSELATENIWVTSVHPGLTRTGSPMNVSFKGKHRLEYAWFMLGDSLPILSMDATRTAQKIVNAVQRGQPELVLTIPAKIAVIVNALAPGLLARAFEVTNALLPSAPKRGGRETRFGFESESPLVPSWLTGMTRTAEKRNNERTHRFAIEHAHGAPE